MKKILHKRLGENGLRIILYKDKVECAVLNQSVSTRQIHEPMSESTVYVVKKAIDNIIDNGIEYNNADGLLVTHVVKAICRVIDQSNQDTGVKDV